MSDSKQDAIVQRYLRRLSKEMADFPAAHRDEVVDEIREHIAEAREVRNAETDADILNILEKVGSPAALAADARERFGLARPTATAADTAGILLIALGGLIVPFIIGLYLIAQSSLWTRRQKTIALGTGAGLFVLSIASLLLPFHNNALSGLLLIGQFGPLLSAVMLLMMARGRMKSSAVSGIILVVLLGAFVFVLFLGPALLAQNASCMESYNNGPMVPCGSTQHVDETFTATPVPTDSAGMIIVK